MHENFFLKKTFSLDFFVSLSSGEGRKKRKKEKEREGKRRKKRKKEKERERWRKKMDLNVLQKLMIFLSLVQRIETTFNTFEER